MPSLRWYSIDLHIHSVLSPCSTWDMSPLKIISRAKEVNLDMISITDHNSLRNFPAFYEAGKKSGIMVLPGIEVQTKEEVHLLVYFKSYIEGLRFEVNLRKNSPLVYDSEDVIKPQLLVDEFDMVKSVEKRFLLISTNLSLEETIKIARRYETLIILAHINRSSFSIFSQLGFIPKGLDVDGVELSLKGKLKINIPENLNQVLFSDAHSLEEIQPNLTTVFLRDLNWDELKTLFKSSNCRNIRRKCDV